MGEQSLCATNVEVLVAVVETLLRLRSVPLANLRWFSAEVIVNVKDDRRTLEPAGASGSANWGSTRLPAGSASRRRS
jgi:hypothetical protein